MAFCVFVVFVFCGYSMVERQKHESRGRFPSAVRNRQGVVCSAEDVAVDDFVGIPYVGGDLTGTFGAVVERLFENVR